MEQYSEEADDVLVRYDVFYKETVAGKYGETVKYWITNVNIVHLYDNFSRAISSGEIDMYVTILKKVANYFIALNHPNYPRWAVKSR